MNGPSAADRWRDRWPDLLVAAAVAVVLIQAWWTRYALNPDGVAYLDLAGRLREGDFLSLVQGYWSPGLPFLIAVVSLATGDAPGTMVLLVHGLGTAAILAAILVLRAWGRRLDRPRFTVAALLALFLVTDGFPKLETVTPDLLLLACLVWLGYELVARQGERPIVTGIVLGLAFLIKTSAWPWLLLSLPLRLWAAEDGMGRRRVLRSGAVTIAMAALWVVPLSIRSGAFTVGSAARLNYAWYVRGTGPERMPDTHQGGHQAYREVALDRGASVTWADYPAADRWTYAPWSDPTGWDAGLRPPRLTGEGAVPRTTWWGRQARYVFRFWLRAFLVAVVIPWGLLEWAPALRLRRAAIPRHAVVAATLGIAGLAQFVFVHAEPRLIAPYALLVGLTILHGPPGTTAHGRVVSRLWPVLALAGSVVAASTGTDALRQGREVEVRQRALLRTIAHRDSVLAAAHIPRSRIAVVGPAVPVMGTAYLSGAHIVAQLLPRSLPALGSTPAAERDALFVRLFGTRAMVVWTTDLDGNYRVLAIRPVTTLAGDQ